MKRIMLCCSAGMSTSLLVRKMKEVAAERGEEVQIDAFGASEFDEKFRDYQVVLLGPQVRYMQADLSARAAEFNIPVETINMMDYGMQRGDNVLDFAFGLRPVGTTEARRIAVVVAEVEKPGIDAGFVRSAMENDRPGIVVENFLGNAAK